MKKLGRIPMKIVENETSISKYIGQHFFIVYGTKYRFGMSAKIRLLNKVIRDKHPIEWIAKRKSCVLINWWEISEGLYNKYVGCNRIEEE